MVRLLILVVLCYLAYWLYKSGKRKKQTTEDDQFKGVDEMVQCPHCGAYFPKTKAYPAKVDGRPLLFCSQQDRDAYLARYKPHDADNK